MHNTDDLFKDFEKYAKNDPHRMPRVGDKEIVIRLKPQIIERALSWTIILVLIGMVIYNPLTSMMKCNCEGDTTNPPTGAAILAGSQEEASVDTETEQAPTETTVEAEPEDPEDTELSGDVLLAIGSIKVEDDDDGNPERITEIEVSIDNQWKDFKPNIKIFFYDIDDDSELGTKKKIRVSYTHPSVLDAGSAKDYTIAKFESAFFSKTDKSEEELIVIVYKLVCK